MYLKPAGASVPFSRRSPFRFPRAGMIFFLSTHSWVFCISFAVAIIFNFHVLSQALTNEGVALLSFKQSITDDPRNFLNNWNALDETPCAWNGVTCIGSKVVSLSIPNMKLTGFLPPIFGNLSALRHLNLRNNNLSGALQVGLFGASGLQSLVLSGNSFSGSIPSEIEKLSLLHTLDFSYNIFNGSLPASFVRCRQLKTLNLSKNGLSGSLPDGFGTGFTLLEHLSLSFNKFSGSIPVDLGNLSSLTGTLDLSHNLFNGAIPASLGNLSEEVYINLCYNNLSGPIPQNGALLDAGPTAFAGNPLLCGAPLKLSCPPGIPAPNSQTDPSFPSQDPTDQSKGGNTLSKGALTLIVASAMFGSCFLGWFLSCMCKRYCDCKVCDSFSSCAVEEGAVLRKENFCFGKEALDVPSEMEQHEFVSLDLQVDFDLDKLLKASAFLLGKSGTGIVYKVVLEEGPTLAVRRLGGDPQRLKDFQTEVEAIAKIKHPNIVPLRAYSWSSDEKLLVYDFISNGDLSTAIHGKVGMASIMPLSWSMRLRIMKGIAKALAYIHEFSPRKYVHGDLKPGNILLGKNMEPYIADFGISRLANFSEEPAKFQLEQILMAVPEQSSPYESTAIYLTDTLRSYYQPPEASQPTKPSQKWDVYSFGMILLEMVTGRKPIVEVGPLRFDLIRWVQVGIEERTPISEIADPSLLLDLDKEQEIVATLQVALACVHKSPEKRPSMRHVLNSLDKLGISSGP